MLLPMVLIVWISWAPVRIVVPATTAPEQAKAIAEAVSEARSTKLLESVLDWSKTILPSAVGFGSAMVGYYFGTRTGPEREEPDPRSSDEDGGELADEAPNSKPEN
jgi:hypothetical protein